MATMDRTPSKGEMPVGLRTEPTLWTTIERLKENPTDFDLKKVKLNVTVEACHIHERTAVLVFSRPFWSRGQHPKDVKLNVGIRDVAHKPVSFFDNVDFEGIVRLNTEGFPTIPAMPKLDFELVDYKFAIKT